MKELKPLAFFGTIAAFLVFISIILAWPIFTAFMETGLVPRIPTAVLTTGIMVLAFLSLTVGLILDSLSRARFEAKRTAYLWYGSVRTEIIRSRPRANRTSSDVIEES